MVLENKTDIITTNQRLIRSNMSRAIEFFADYPDLFHWIPPQAGPIAFPRWIGSASLDRFCHDLVEKAGVMIVPASQFIYPEPHFRIGLGRQNFCEGLEMLGVFLRLN